jgi:ABC-type lipoprotein release transport system permease subunit
MIGFLARRNLLRQRSRTLLCVLGLTVSTALLYDMALLSSGLRASLGKVLAEIGYDLRVLPKGGLPFSSEAELAQGHALAAELARVPGVAEAQPLWATTLYLARPGRAGRALSAFALGLDPEHQTLYHMRSGDAGGVVLNPRLADSLGVVPGDTLLASASQDGGGTLLVVRGIADFRLDLRSQRTLALAPRALAAIAGRTDDPASFLLGKLAPGADAGAVVARWQALHPETDAYEVSRLLGEIRGQLSYFQQFSLILGTVSLVVTFLLVLTLLTLSVNERQGELAILRALGLKAPRVMLLVLVEGLVLALLALVPGFLLGAAAARGLDAILTSSPGIPAGLSFFVPGAGAVGSTALLVLASAALAGAYPAWLASRTNVALTLHREVT